MSFFNTIRRGLARIAGRPSTVGNDASPVDEMEESLLGELCIGYVKQNALDKADRLVTTALKGRPASPYLLFLKANVLFFRGEYQGALFHYRQAIEKNPHFVDAYLNLAVLHERLGDAAASSNARGNALMLKGELAEASACCRKAVQLAPDRAAYFFDLGRVLHKARDYEVAVEAFDQAIHTDPNDSAACWNKGLALQFLGRHADALRLYETAVDLSPDDGFANFYLATGLLLHGDYRGWKHYRGRWHGPLAHERREMPMPEWDGLVSLEGKRLLLHAEQGLGDTLQFSRFVPEFKKLGAQIVFQVQPPLIPLYKNCPDIDVLMETDSPVPACDYHLPLMGAPAVLGLTPQGVPPPFPFELGDDSVEGSGLFLPALEKEGGCLNIGVAWSGNPDYGHDHIRSMSCQEFMNGLPPGPRYFVLQKNISESERALIQSRPDVIPVSDRFESFLDTARFARHLDLIITVDTSIIHLGGSLGVESWLLLSSFSDWRWELGSASSRWYPSVRIIKQSSLLDWAPVMSEVFSRIKDRVQ